MAKGRIFISGMQPIHNPSPQPGPSSKLLDLHMQLNYSVDEVVSNGVGLMKLVKMTQLRPLWTVRN